MGNTDVLEELATDSDDSLTADEGEAEAPPDDPPRTRRKWPSRVTIAVLALLVVGLAALSGYLGWQVKNTRDIDAAKEAALRAANSYAVTLTSVDSGNLDANFTAVLDGSIGEFHDIYTKSSAQLRQLLIDHKATGHGVVLDSAVKSATKDQVVILLFVDQTVTNTEVPDPRVDRSRIELTMQKIDGQWKAAKVELP
ncbi:Mce protein [Mycobacterium sp. pUA109]|uniref:Mce protein n=1 Tax=Mycobacterium sp. pUA109 TaxID=3238982 RepID=UPI00351B4B3F